MIQQIQLEALKTLKYKDEEALQKINDRKSITTNGSSNTATQNCTWTFNWAIWKFYNSIRHKQTPYYRKLSDIFLFRLSIEEFRTFNFFKEEQKLDLEKQNKNWKKGASIYKFIDFSNPKITLKRSDIIDNLYIL